jgi:3-dehydrosphinganine reductase
VLRQIALQDARVNGKQVFKSFSFAVDTLAGARDAYNAACKAHNNTTPDVAFLCAGAAYPGFWVEASEEMMKKSMDQSYWVSAWSAKVCHSLSVMSCLFSAPSGQAVSERMARERRTGKIVFVSSIIAYFGLTGYSTYSAGKFALRGAFLISPQSFV